MSAATWLIIAIIGFSLAGIAFIAAIFLFIKMNIPAIIGDLTGKTVAREIKAMRETNALGGDRRFRPSAVNLERGALTEKVTPDAEAIKIAHASKRLDRTGDVGASGKLERRRAGMSGAISGGPAVNRVSAQNVVLTTERLSDNATEVLTENMTEVLTENMTEVLTGNMTEVLTGNMTEVLTENMTEVLTENMTEVLTENMAEVLSVNEMEAVSSGTTVLSGGTSVLNATEELYEAVVPSVSFRIVRSEVVTQTDEVIV